MATIEEIPSAVPAETETFAFQVGHNYSLSWHYSMPQWYVLHHSSLRTKAYEIVTGEGLCKQRKIMGSVFE